MQPAETARSGGSNKRLFIIIGAIIIAFVLIAFAVVAGAVGIFLYTSRESGYVAESSDKTENAAPRNVAEGPLPPDPASNDRLIAKIRERPAVGDFELQNVVPTYAGKEFLNSVGEVKGIYSGPGSVDLTMITAEYDSKTRVSSDFGRMIGRARAAGAKMVSKITVKGPMISAAYENGREKTIAFCNWQVETEVICNLVSSENGDAIAKFADAMSKQTRN